MFKHEGGFVPGQVQGDKALMGEGLMRGGNRPYGGGSNFDRLYHKLNILLLLSCNYMMQFISYNFIKTHRFLSYCFQIHTITQHQYKTISVTNRIM